MYKCHVCHSVSAPKQSKRVHILHRAVPSGQRDHRGKPLLREEISRELPVCQVCGDCLDAGLTLKWLIRDRRPKEEPKTVIVNVPDVLQIPAQPVFKPVFLGTSIAR